MKAVILAAGEGQRMRPLTLTTPKPLLKIKGKPVIEHVLGALPPEVSEVIVAVRYLANQIKNHLGSEFGGRKIVYVEGYERGSAYSFLAAKPNLVGERFLLVNGDEFPNPEDVRNCLLQESSIVTFISHNPKLHGIATLRSDGTIEAIVEKPEKSESKIAVGGIMVLNYAIFNYQPCPNQKGEYYLTSLLNQFTKDHRLVGVESKNFIGDITTPFDLERVEKLL